MKLLIVAGSGSPWSYRVIQTLAELSAEIHVIQVPPEAREAYIDPNSDAWRAEQERLRSAVSSLESVTLPAGQRRYFSLARRIRRMARQIQPDQVLTLYGGGLAFAAALSGIKPFAVYLVGSDVHSLSRVNRLVSRWSLSKAAVVFANGDALTDQARALAPKASIESLLLGVDTGLFTPGDPAPDPIRMVCSRGFSEVYNNRAILEALSQIPEGAPDWRFTFLAGGSLLQDCKDWADAHLPSWMRDRVIFLGGVSPERLREELQGSHVFVSMSLADGTATSLLEALACGLRPILSEIPANRGWSAGNPLAVPTDPKDISAKIQQTLQSGSPSDEERRKYRNLVLERADARENMKRLLDRLGAG